MVVIKSVNTTKVKVELEISEYSKFAQLGT